MARKAWPPPHAKNPTLSCSRSPCPSWPERPYSPSCAPPGTKNTPVITLTAQSGHEDALQTDHLGVRDYLVKPFKDEQLLEKFGKAVPLHKKTPPALAA